MSDIVTCACGKRLKLPEGSKAKAVRCPSCKEVVRIDAASAPPAAATAAAAPARPAAVASAPSPKAPSPRAPVATAAAPATRPAEKPNPAGPPPRRLVEDPPNVWLYVDDPEIIAKVEAEGDGRHTSLRTYGPDEDPLADLGVKNTKDIRNYLSDHEYIAWASWPSNFKPPSKNYVGWIVGGVFAIVGLAIAAFGYFIELPPPAPVIFVRIVAWLVGGLFTLGGLYLLYKMLRGAEVVAMEPARRGLYMITNRRCIVWRGKDAVRSFSGPVVMGLGRMTEDDEQDVGSLMFTHGLAGGIGGFVHVDKVSEVEEVVRSYLVDPVLEKAGVAPSLGQMTGPNPFKKGDKGDKEKKGPKEIELWEACAMEWEVEQEVPPEAIKSAKEESKRKLQEADLHESDAKLVRGVLKPGEAIVWVSRANAAAFFKKAWRFTWSMLIFIVVAGGMVAGALAMAGEQATTEVYLMVGGIFGALGAAGILWALLHPFYTRARFQKMLYVLTNRRALIWVPKWNGEMIMVMFGPRELSSIFVRGNSVVFGTRARADRDQRGTATVTVSYFGFLEIEDAPRVERKIRDLLVDPFLNKAYA